MRNRSTPLLIPLAFALLASCVKAQADHQPVSKASDAPRLQLSQLVEEALGKNSELQAAKDETTVKEAAVGPRGAYEDPMLAFEAQNYPVDTFSSRESPMTGNQLSLTQKIPFPGKLSRLSRAAELDAAAQKQEARAKELEIVKKVKLAYYSLALLYKKYDLLNDQKNVLTQLTAVTRSHYSLGRASQAEVLNLQVEEASLLDQLLGVERQIKSVTGELNHLLGRADHHAYTYGRPEEIRRTPFDFATNTEKVVAERIFKLSPMLSGKRASVDAAEARVSYAKWSYLPDLEFRLGYTFRKPSPGDNGVDFISGMIGVTIPIWAASRQSEEKRGAEAARHRAEALAAEERNNTGHMVHVLYAELEETSKRLDLFEGGVLPMTRQAVISGRSAYGTGKLAYATLMNLVTKRYQMEITYAEALTMYESKIAELEAMMGEPLGT